MKKKILVIDDILDNAAALKTRLEEEGFEVKSTCDGRIGIQSAINEMPDLIICDVMMPEINGYQVMNELKENPGTAAIPFIFLSARANNGVMRQGMKLEADDYLTKPFQQPRANQRY